MDTKPASTAQSLVTENTGNRPRISSKDLFSGASTVEIEHAGQHYLLRVTRENKLILTK